MERTRSHRPSGLLFGDRVEPERIAMLILRDPFVAARPRRKAPVAFDRPPVAITDLAGTPPAARAGRGLEEACLLHLMLAFVDVYEAGIRPTQIRPNSGRRLE